MNVLSFCYQGREVRTAQKNGEPWFVAADVCKALELSNGRQAVARLDDDEKGVISTDTLGGKQEMTIINEPGLYTLILSSRKPEAKQFKRWVTHEVLPSIRRGGYYVHHNTAVAPYKGEGKPQDCNMSGMEVLAVIERQLCVMRELEVRQRQQEKELYAISSKVDKLTAGNKTCKASSASLPAVDANTEIKTSAEVAQLLGFSSTFTLNKRLHEMGMIEPKNKSRWRLTNKYTKKGYAITERGDLRWTPQGVQAIRRVLKQHGVKTQ